jgi:hypothetical protein
MELQDSLINILLSRGIKMVSKLKGRIYPRCPECDERTHAIHEWLKRSEIESKYKQMTSVEYINKGQATTLYICRNKECRRIFAEDGRLFAVPLI